MSADFRRRLLEKSVLIKTQLDKQKGLLQRSAACRAQSCCQRLQHAACVTQQQWHKYYQAAAGFVSGKITAAATFYNRVRTAWNDNQHFTFLLIPANGQNVAKKHVARKHLKCTFMGTAAVVLALIGSFGYMAHHTFLSLEQQREIAEYKQTKRAQEETIQHLQQMAEKNQKELAQLHELEQQVRQQLAKSGVQLPPKTDSAATAQGGPVEGTSQLSVIYAQERNIHLYAKAKAADFTNLLTTIKNENYRKEVTPTLWPTSGGEITSYFGYRSNPFGGWGSDYHPGIDIANYYGAPVYATATGYVQEAGWYGGYGRYVRISHDSGYDTAYAHMSSIATHAGAYVEKGDVIGYVGSSGYSTGPHLHYEVLSGGRHLQPLDFIG